MAQTTVVLEIEPFNDFIRCLTNLKEVCNDADIRDGILRQRTNNHTSVFEVNLQALFQEPINIALTNLKQKLELLKSFQGQAVEVTIEDICSKMIIHQLNSSLLLWSLWITNT